MTLLIDWEGGKQYQYLRKTFRRKNLRENRLFASEWTVGEKYSAHNVKFYIKYFTPKQPIHP